MQTKKIVIFLITIYSLNDHLFYLYFYLFITLYYRYYIQNYFFTHKYKVLLLMLIGRNLGSEEGI